MFLVEQFFWGVEQLYILGRAALYFGGAVFFGVEQLSHLDGVAFYFE